MNAPEPAQSFEAARRRHLIEATIETLADVGFKAASLAEISRRANVSTGLFAHYFGDKDGLLEATLRFMASRLARATAARLRAAATPRDRLFAVAEAALAEEEFDRRTSAVWLAFWGQIMHSAPYRRVQSIYQRRMLSNLRHGLIGLVPPERAEGAARLIAATIDGLWLQSHAVEGAHDGRHARATVRQLIDVLIADGGKVEEPETGPALSATTASYARPTTLVLRDPATGEKLAERRIARVMEIDAAIVRATAGLPAWRATSAANRRCVLQRVTDALRADAPALARLEARATGRPVAETATFDVARAIRAFERAAEIAGRPVARRVAFDEVTFGYVAPPPPAIVACAVDADAPLLSISRRVAEALAAGRAALVLTGPPGVMAAERLVELLQAAGAPDGVLTVVPGDEETGGLLRAHPAVSAAAWSTAAELAAVVVLDDADLARAATAILRGPRRWTPSRRLSETVVFVDRRVSAAFERHLVAEMSALRFGDPQDSDAEIGAVLSHDHLDVALNAVRDSVAAGGRVLCGGRRATGDGLDAGAFLSPTVVAGCREDMTIARGGLFAPLVALVAFRDDDDVVARLRGERRPGSVGIFAGDVGHARRLAGRLDAAVTVLNDYEAAHVDASVDDWLDDPVSGTSGGVRRVLVRYAAPPEA